MSEAGETVEDQSRRKSQRTSKPSKRKESPSQSMTKTTKSQKQQSVLKDHLAAKRTIVSETARKKAQKNQGPIAAAFEKAKSSKTLHTDSKESSSLGTSSSSSSSSSSPAMSQTDSSVLSSSEPPVQVVSVDSNLNTPAPMVSTPIVPPKTPGILSVTSIGSTGKMVQQEKKTHVTPASASEAWDFFFKIKVPGQEREYVCCHICKQVESIVVRMVQVYVFTGSTSTMLEHIKKHPSERTPRQNKQPKLSLRPNTKIKNQELDFLYAASLAMDCRAHNSGFKHVFTIVRREERYQIVPLPVWIHTTHSCNRVVTSSSNV